MSKYLVTGGAGFIGSHLVELLQSENHEVIVLDDLSTGLSDNLGHDVEFILGDICSEEDVAHAIANVDGCFHLAAIASVQKYNDAWHNASKVNSLGSVNIFNAAAKLDVPVVYASSAAVYGDNTNVPLLETSSTKPISGYGADKLAMEHHAMAMSSSMGLNAVGLRFFNVFGPRQLPGSPYSGVISIFLDRLGQNQSITIFGDGSQSRDFVFVTDIAAALTRAMSHAKAGNSGVFNVCGGTPITVLELANIIAQVYEIEAKINFEDSRAGDILVSLGNPSLASQEIDFTTKVSLSDGLKETADWFLARG